MATIQRKVQPLALLLTAAACTSPASDATMNSMSSAGRSATAVSHPEEASADRTMLDARAAAMTGAAGAQAVTGTAGASAAMGAAPAVPSPGAGARAATQGSATKATEIMQPVPETFLADAGGGWSTLLTAHWDLPAGNEGYYCARYTPAKSVMVSAFHAVAPVGTHHTLLTIADDKSSPDGVGKCDANTNGPRNVLGTGVGQSELTMPEGVGMELKAGEQLLLNLHLFNLSDKPLTGLSGTLVKLVAPASIKSKAEEAMAGPVMLNIPAGGRTTQTGECTITHDSTVFAVGPHMHQLGIYLKAVATSSMMGEVVLHDAPYDFDNPQLLYLPQEIPMKAGDKVKVECTYQNDTGRAVMFGNSSTAEMCFLGLFRYPDGQKSYICAR